MASGRQPDFYFFKSSVGTFEIALRPDGRRKLAFEGSGLGSYVTAAMAADEVQTHVTAYFELGSRLGEKVPRDLSEWQTDHHSLRR